jgi:hypothetical protein
MHGVLSGRYFPMSAYWPQINSSYISKKDEPASNTLHAGVAKLFNLCNQPCAEHHSRVGGQA